MFAVKYIEGGLLEYGRALGLIQGLVSGVQKGTNPQALILCSHPAVITLGRRASQADLMLSPAQLNAQGVEVVRVERGGLATYHGPGQLMAYPLLRLADLGLGVEALVTELEEAVIQTLWGLGVRAVQDPEHRGVWVRGKKIASIGLKISRGVSAHGLALNLGSDLSGFELINPCGLGQGRMTSLARELGRELDPSEIAPSLAQNLAQGLGLSLTPWPLEEALKAASGSALDQADDKQEDHRPGGGGDERPH